MKKRYLIYIIIGVTLCACRQHASTVTPLPTAAIHGDSVPVFTYSQLLRMDDCEGYTVCDIQNPWHTDETLQRYLLVPSADSTWTDALANTLTERYGAMTVVRTPLSRLTLTATCHAWLLSQLHALDHVAVMCDTAYINAANLKQWLHTTPELVDGGSSMAPNAEVILSCQSDAIWISPFENMSFGNLMAMSLPIIYCADYLENSPLGRAEWMKLYGRLVGRGAEADVLFAQVAARYEQSVATADNGRTLLAELPYGATWYVPGGCSTAALLYQDAGYRYPWADDRHAGSLALSKEAVFAKAHDCDVWLIKHEGPLTLAQLKQQNPLFAEFKAAREGQVWGCNTAVSDLFDVTPFRPDTLLQSLIDMDGAFYQRLP